MARDTRHVQTHTGRTRGRSCCDCPCCQELLMSAVNGMVTQDHSLEQALDRLERVT